MLNISGILQTIKEMNDLNVDNEYIGHSTNYKRNEQCFQINVLITLIYVIQKLIF